MCQAQNDRFLADFRPADLIRKDENRIKFIVVFMWIVYRCHVHNSRDTMQEYLILPPSIYYKNHFFAQHQAI